MGIQNLSENVLLINLPEQPQQGDELESVHGMLGDRIGSDVVIDFTKVKMLTSESICGLMILERLLRGAGHRLILCSVPSKIKQIFVRTGLLTVFEFTDDELAALECLRSGQMSWAGI